MPIKGLTDRKEEAPQFVRFGKIRKGGERPESGDRPGRDLDHWRVTFEDAYKGIKPAFDAKFKEKPTELEVILLGRTPEDCFTTWNEEWNATNLIHRCDGERQEYGIGGNGRYYRGLPCAKGDNAQEQDLATYACKCIRVGRLTVAIPWMWESGQVTTPGVFVMETHSIYDIIHIHRRLATMYGMYGNLLRVPAILGRSPREISHAIGNGKRKKRFSHLVTLREDLTRMGGTAFLDSPAVPVHLPDEVPAELARRVEPPLPPVRRGSNGAEQENHQSSNAEGEFQFVATRITENRNPQGGRSPRWHVHGEQPADGYAPRAGLWDVGFIATMLAMETEELETLLASDGLVFEANYPLILRAERKGRYINIHQEGHNSTLGNPAIGRMAGRDLMRVIAEVGGAKSSAEVLRATLDVKQISDSKLTLAGAKAAIQKWLMDEQQKSISPPREFAAGDDIPFGDHSADDEMPY